MKISIIGTAGRERESRLNLQLYLAALSRVRSLVAEHTDVTLVSGGAAWMDHLAVALYMEGAAPRLDLHFPAPWVPTEPAFDNENFAGKVANYYHRKFSTTLGGDPYASLRGLQQAMNQGAVSKVYSGFHARNVPVSQSDLTIALTWGKQEPSSPGTAHTWRLVGNRPKIHVSLHDLV